MHVSCGPWAGTYGQQPMCSVLWAEAHARAPMGGGLRAGGYMGAVLGSLWSGWSTLGLCRAALDCAVHYYIVDQAVLGVRILTELVWILSSSCLDA